MCAGEPHEGTTNDTQGRVYPRVCGGTGGVSATNPACAGTTTLASSDPWVYPRVCGGTRGVRCNHRPSCGGTGSSLVNASLVSGLSPRVRGNRPARKSKRAPSSVYPRVCGGTRWVASRGMFYLGLSPRVRGNLAAERPFVGFHRSIPACAGEPPIVSRLSELSTVYPRVCGGTPRD